MEFILKRLALTLAVTAFAALPNLSVAQGDIFVCVDESGQKIFQNTGNVKGCKRLDVQPILTVPAQRHPAGRGSAAARSEDRVTVSPANFPRVDRETQRLRDSDRRRILEDELRAEEERLARLKAEYNDGEPERRGDERNDALYRERVQRLLEDIGRAENNASSLRRELALLRIQ
jgi:hypothetical protein